MMLKSVTQVFSYSLIVKAIGALTTVVIIRMLTTDQYADYTLALAIASTLQGVIASASNRIFIVGYSRFDIYENEGSFLSWQILLLVLVSMLAYPFMQESILLYVLALFFALASSILQFIRTCYQRSLRFNRFSQVTLAKSALFLMGTAVLAVIFGTRLQAWQILLVQSGAMLTVAIPLIVRRRLSTGLLDIETVLRIGKAIFAGSYLYLFAYLLILAIFSQLNVFMLKAFSDNYDLATYGSAFRYYGFLLIGLDAVKAVYLPFIQEAKSKNEIVRVFNQHRLLIVVASAIVVFAIIVSRWMIPLIDAGKYPDAVPTFRMLALSALISFALSPYMAILMRFERFLFLLMVMTSVSILGFGLGAVLISLKGSTGAALVTLVGYGFVNLSAFIYAQRLIKDLPEFFNK
jgi:O-antigen/teichoic acid export membrane protein